MSHDLFSQKWHATEVLREHLFCFRNETCCHSPCTKPRTLGTRLLRKKKLVTWRANDRNKTHAGSLEPIGRSAAVFSDSCTQSKDEDRIWSQLQIWSLPSNHETLEIHTSATPHNLT